MSTDKINQNTIEVNTNLEKETDGEIFSTTNVIAPNGKLVFTTESTHISLFRNISISSDVPVTVKSNYQDLELILTKLMVEGVEWVLIEISNYNEVPANVSIILA